MPSPSRGKKFELELKRALIHHPAVGWLHRPQDPTFSSGTRFAKHNPIDFVGCTSRGRGLFVEAKALKGQSLPFSRFSRGQWGALYRCWRAGAATYAALNWYGWAERDGVRGRAFLVPLGWLAQLRRELWGQRKSWPVGDLIEGPGVIELGKVARSWTLDASVF